MSQEPDTYGRALLTAELRRDEGEVLHAYQDHLGYVTIGIGRMIDQRRGGGISREESAMLLDNDITRVAAAYDRAIPWWRRLSPVRQRALLNMGFQMGPAAVTNATNTMAILQRATFNNNLWPEVERMLRAWKWAREQTPRRADRVIRQLCYEEVANGG